MKKNNNKGFTLVELIVVLVILAILAAILVPALLGYIDKAREKQVTTNAEAAYVAAQALATEAYGKNNKAPTNSNTYKSGSTADVSTVAAIKKLTDIDESFSVVISYKNSGDHKGYIISEFTYIQTGSSVNNKKQAKWTLASGGNWEVSDAPANP